MASCPDCGAPNTFSPRRRDLGEGIEVFIRCRVCPYELVLCSGPKEIVELQEEVEYLRGRVAAGEDTLRSLLHAREVRLARFIAVQNTAR